MADLPTTDAEWKRRLSPQQFRVLRKAGTERAGTGALAHVHDDGAYRCAGCHTPLFSSDDRFESGTGWPSFSDVDSPHVGTRSDRKLLFKRTEVHCDVCGGHLGHVFRDGPNPTGLRYCLNSAALELETTDGRVISGASDA